MPSIPFLPDAEHITLAKQEANAHLEEISSQQNMNGNFNINSISWNSAVYSESRAFKMNFKEEIHIASGKVGAQAPAIWKSQIRFDKACHSLVTW